MAKNKKENRRPFPLSARILKVFVKKTTGTSKLPLPKAVCYTFQCPESVVQAWVLSAFAIDLEFDTYLRAHNVSALEASDFMPPAPGSKERLRCPWALLVAPLV